MLDYIGGWIYALSGGALCNPGVESAEDAAARAAAEPYVVEAIANAAYHAIKNGQDVSDWNLQAWGLNPDSILASANSVEAIVDRQTMENEQRQDAA